jgi:hypothetical protein
MGQSASRKSKDSNILPLDATLSAVQYPHRLTFSESPSSCVAAVVPNPGGLAVQRRAEQPMLSRGCNYAKKTKKV